MQSKSLDSDKVAYSKHSGKQHLVVNGEGQSSSQGVEQAI